MGILRTAVDRAERAFSAQVVEWIDTPAVAEALLEAGRFGARALRGLDDVRSSAVHLLFLPSQRDIRMLSAQVARLSTALAEVEAQLDDLRAER